MKIYITGIAGFLGSHLAKKLTDQGHEVGGNDSMIQGDLENLPKNISFHKTDCCNYLWRWFTKKMFFLYRWCNLLFRKTCFR